MLSDTTTHDQELRPRRWEPAPETAHGLTLPGSESWLLKARRPSRERQRSRCSPPETTASTSSRRSRVSLPTFTLGSRPWYIHFLMAASLTASVLAASLTVM